MSQDVSPLSLSILNQNRQQTINLILEQQPQYYDSINKNLAPQVLVQLGSALLQQRKQLKLNTSRINDQVADLKSQLLYQKQQVEQMKQHITVLQQQIENLRNLMSTKQEQNQKKYNQLSQTSFSMLEQITAQLRRQRQANSQLKHSVKELKMQENQMHKLSISLSKKIQQNQSLKQLFNWNCLLSEQLLQNQQKLADSKQLEKQLREQNQRIRDDVLRLTQKIAELQYISKNQISKQKDFRSEDHQTHGKNKISDYETRHFQHAKVFKQLEQNYQKQFLAQSVKREGSQARAKSQDFQKSLDRVSQVMDKVTLKEIQASSKSKQFIDHNMFDLQQGGSQPGNQQNYQLISKTQQQKTHNFSSKAKKIRQAPQFNSNMQQILYIPLSIQKSIEKKKQQEDNCATVAKQKAKLSIEIFNQQVDQVDQVFQPLSSRSQHFNKISHAKSTFKTPKQEPHSRIMHRNTINNQLRRGIHFSQNKLQQSLRQIKIKSLQQKLIQYQNRNNILQQQANKLQQLVQNQSKAFNQQAYFQIQSIQRLSNEIKQLKLSNLQMQQQNKQNQQKLKQKIQELTDRCMKLQRDKLQQEKQINKFNKKMLDMEIHVQEQNTIIKIQKLSKSPDKDKHKYRIYKVCQLFIDNAKKNRIQQRGFQTQLMQQQKCFNTDISFNNRQAYFVNVETDTRNLIEMVDKQVQSRMYVEQNKSVQTENKKKFVIWNSMRIQLPGKSAINYQTQTENLKQFAKNMLQLVKIHKIQQNNKNTQTFYKPKLAKYYPQVVSLACNTYNNKQIQTDEQLYPQLPNQSSSPSNQKQNPHKKNKQQYQNKPIKKFIPTPLIQQLKQQYGVQQILQQQYKQQNISTPYPSSPSLKKQKQKQRQRQNKNKQQSPKFYNIDSNFDFCQNANIKQDWNGNRRQDIDQTMYYSFICQDSPQRSGKNIRDKEKLRTQKKKSCKVVDNVQNQEQLDESLSMDITSTIVDLNKILIRYSVIHNYTSNLPKINTIKQQSKLKFANMISRCRENIKQFYILTAQLQNGKQSCIDNIMFWKQGLVSLKLNSCIMMIRANKIIHDPENLVLGNSQVILNRLFNMIEINRKGKKTYFQGEMKDCKWTVFNIEGYGTY